MRLGSGCRDGGILFHPLPLGWIARVDWWVGREGNGASEIKEQQHGTEYEIMLNGLSETRR